MQKQTVYIIGGEHHNTLSMVRCLGERGMQVNAIVCGVKHSCIEKSRYAKVVVCVPSSDEAVRYLKEHSNNGRSLVIPCSDEIAWLLDKEQDNLSQHYVFFKIKNSDGTLMEHYMDKQVQTELAQTCGMSVPVVYTKENVQYPCIIKPLESIRGGKHICICHDRGSFEERIKEFEDTPVTIQQLLTIDEEIVIVGLSVNDEIILPAYVHKIREESGGTTYSSIHPISKLPQQLITSVKSLVRKLNYEGLFGVEFIRMENEYYFVEANLRNDATCYALAMAGVNLPYIYYLAKTGRDYTVEVQKPIREIHSMVEIRDFLSYTLRGKVSLSMWLQQYRKAECRYYNSKGDKAPFRSAVYSAIKQAIGRRLNH